MKGVACLNSFPSANAAIFFAPCSVVPLFKATGLMLVQVRPQHLKAALDRCKREVCYAVFAVLLLGAANLLLRCYP